MNAILTYISNLKILKWIQDLNDMVELHRNRLDWHQCILIYKNGDTRFYKEKGFPGFVTKEYIRIPRKLNFTIEDITKPTLLEYDWFELDKFEFIENKRIATYKQIEWNHEKTT